MAPKETIVIPEGTSELLRKPEKNAWSVSCIELAQDIVKAYPSEFAP